MGSAPMDSGTPTMAIGKKNDIAFFIILALLFSWIFRVPREFLGYDLGLFGRCLYYGISLGPVLAALGLLLGGFVKWHAGNTCMGQDRL